MPGIVGLITKEPRERAEYQLRQMVAVLCHESFYVSGTWVDESLGVYAGWIARKDSFSDCMPVCNKRGDVVLVFSGEEYPEPETTRRLKEQGYSSDDKKASYLVRLSEEDPNFPAGLNGRFHGLLTNRRSGTVMLFNDRYGMHRIYYHNSKEAFYFAAEAKAILAVRPELRSVDARGLAELVVCGCTLENRALFRSIHVLPPASKWVLHAGLAPRQGKYFEQHEWEDQSTLASESYYQRVREVFSRNLPRYFNGQERVGMSLTGGLDTRMIMAWQRSPPGSLPCYSFGGMFRDCQDVVLARQVARACGQSYEVLSVGRDFLSRFPYYAERTVYLTDGCTDVSLSPVLYANVQASEIAPVRITGNYGGEVLRCMRAFKARNPIPDLFVPELLPQFETARETYTSLLRGHPLSFAVFRQAPWHHYGLLALEQTQLCLRSPFLDNDLVRTVYTAPDSVVSDSKVSLRLIADGNPSLARIRTDLGLAGEHGRVAASLFRQLLMFTFKAEYAYDYGMPQPVAKIDHILSSFHLERLFLGRHKYYHFRIWYRDALAEYVREMLLDSRTLSRPYLNRKTVETVVGGHLKGSRNYTTAIHLLLTLELLHRLFLDPQ
jgi:asparagine synthase (glutamine-hydrolysing)